jgi:hypothetical protein
LKNNLKFSRNERLFLNMWENYFSQLLNAYSVNDVRQIEIHTAEPLIPGFSLEDEIAIAELKKYKSSGCEQIPGELIQAGDEKLFSLFGKRTIA